MRGEKISMRSEKQFIRRDKLSSRSRTAYNSNMQNQIKPKRQGARGPVASQFFGDVPGDSLHHDDMNRQFYGSSFEMKDAKGALDSQE